MRSAVSSTEAGLRYQTGRGFRGQINSCRYVKGLSWGASCLQTNTKENQDGWSVNALVTTENEPGRNRGMVLKPNYRVLHWSHEQQSMLSAEPAEAESKENELVTAEPDEPLYCDTISFAVLDGHGVGGRHASAAIELALKHAFNEFAEAASTLALDSPPFLINALIDVLDLTLKRAQSEIEALNELLHKDFGSTFVSVTIVNDVILTASCGDSSALLVAVPHTGTRSPLIVELGRRHHLTDEIEVARVQKEGRGRIIVGDGGILRLIPANVSYTAAKKSGLSINMARSLGHAVFKNFGLSVEADFTFLTLGTLPKLLKESQNKGPTRSYYRLPPLDVHGCKTLSLAYGATSRPRRELAVTTDESSPHTVEAKLVSKRGSDISLTSAARKSIPADLYILLLSDGVTDVFNSACLLEMIKGLDHNTTDVLMFARELTAAARDRRVKAGQRSDNCTCIGIHLIPNS